MAATLAASYFSDQPEDCTKFLSTLQQSFGFTRNEVKVILLLTGTFLAGVGIRWYTSNLESHAGTSRHFDYARSDSIFAVRSKMSNRTDTSGTVPEKVLASHQKPKAGTQGPAVNINTATKTQLMRLPGIGPAFAERIIRYRLEHGPFSAIEDMQKVSGIGKKRLGRLRGLVTVK